MCTILKPTFSLRDRSGLLTAAQEGKAVSMNQERHIPVPKSSWHINSHSHSPPSVSQR